MRRWARERFSAFAYAITVLAVRLGMRLCSRLEVLHADRVPREGPVILVANHLTNADPVLVCACAPRTLRVMAKRELFELPLVGWTLWAFGAFPVRRWSADLGALRAGRNHLRAGRAVLVFPEGTRSESRALQPALPGSAVLALLGGAPVVPVAITGMEAFAGPRGALRAMLGRRRPVRVEFGEPFPLPPGPPTSARAGEATDRIMRRVATLLPERYRGAYGPGSEGRRWPAIRRTDPGSREPPWASRTISARAR